MRRAIFTGSLSLSLSLFCGVIAGCQEPGPIAGIIGSPVAPAEPEVEIDPAAALAERAQAQADRLAGVTPSEGQARANPPQEIIWRDMAVEPQADTAIEPDLSLADTQPTLATFPEPAAEPVAAVVEETPPQKPDTQTKAAADAQLSRSQAYAQLIRAVRYGDDSNLSKALTAATLGTVGPHGELDWSLLASLSPQDQERVKRYHRAVSILHNEALSGTGEIDQDAVTGKLEELYGSQPVTIRSIELCEKVLGYGVYDTFPDREFVAGRAQKMIVYVELDHFKSAQRSEADGYEVRLRQELELYESNGFEVWSHEPVEILDVSRNQRRDFFVVQLVTLPAQLALGEYRLKVRIYDENAGTRDESSIPIRIVADESLVKQSAR